MQLCMDLGLAPRLTASPGCRTCSGVGLDPKFLEGKQWILMLFAEVLAYLL